MHRFGLIAALLLALVPQPLRASDDLLARMAALNPGLQSYTAVMHAHVTLANLPYAATDITATYYHKNPDFDKLEITSGLPALAKGFSTLYTHIEPASRWKALYVVTDEGDDGTTTTFSLVPRVPDNVTRIVARVSDAAATVTSMRWEFKNGAWATLDDRYGQIKGETLVVSQTGHVEEPIYKGDITATYSDYTLNPPLPDSLFTK